MPKVPQSKTELQHHLEQQVGFLCRSSEAFDAGHEDEAKRLAVVMRTLLHDTKNSESLLRQLDLLPDLLFYDTASPINPRNLAATDGLTFMHLSVSPSAGAEAVYEAPLDSPRPDSSSALRGFSDWWNRPVIKDSRGSQFSRRDLVLNVADRDGGAHVDPTLDEEYVALTRDNSMGWTFGQGDETPKSFPPPHLASIRQVAHEVLATLAWKVPEALRDSEYVSAHCVANLDSVRIEGCDAGRNAPCPCGSGKKFKKCHGGNSP